jgi:hypothetical protein
MDDFIAALSDETKAKVIEAALRNVTNLPFSPGSN